MSSDCLGTINQRTRVCWLPILSGCFPCPKYGVESSLPSRTTRIKRISISWILADFEGDAGPTQRKAYHFWRLIKGIGERPWTDANPRTSYGRHASVAQTSLVFNLSEFQLRWHLVQQVTWTRRHQFLGPETGSENNVWHPYYSFQRVVGGWRSSKTRQDLIRNIIPLLKPGKKGYSCKLPRHNLAIEQYPIKSTGKLLFQQRQVSGW